MALRTTIASSDDLSLMFSVTIQSPKSLYINEIGRSTASAWITIHAAFSKSRLHCQCGSNGVRYSTVPAKCELREATFPCVKMHAFLRGMARDRIIDLLLTLMSQKNYNVPLDDPTIAGSGIWGICIYYALESDFFSSFPNRCLRRAFTGHDPFACGFFLWSGT